MGGSCFFKEISIGIDHITHVVGKISSLDVSHELFNLVDYQQWFAAIEAYSDCFLGVFIDEADNIAGIPCRIGVLEWYTIFSVI